MPVIRTCWIRSRRNWASASGLPSKGKFSLINHVLQAELLLDVFAEKGGGPRVHATTGALALALGTLTSLAARPLARLTTSALALPLALTLLSALALALASLTGPLSPTHHLSSLEPEKDLDLFVGQHNSRVSREEIVELGEPPNNTCLHLLWKDVILALAPQPRRLGQILR